LVPRVLTALVGIPVILAAIWWGAPWLTLLVALAVALGLAEFYRLTAPGVGRLPIFLGILWAVALALIGGIAESPLGLLRASAWALLVGVFAALLWLIALYRGGKLPLAAIYLLAGPLYLGFSLAHALALYHWGNDLAIGRGWLLFALFVTFASDTGAFFTGRAVGRHKMAPSISPGKTWEGAAGGFLLALLAALALAQALKLGLPFWQAGLIGAATAVAAQAGDLWESKLKRLSRVKDSGSIIPGHGGILDRLDSLVFAIPAVYYLVAVVFKA